jgi:predicted CXXCH cytochrome family protein
MYTHISGWLVLLGFLSLTGPIAAADALELIWPLQGTYVTKSNYLIIKGGRDPFLDGLSIEINGVKSDVIDLRGEEYRALFADKLVVEPIFDPGENLVIVEGFMNGERMVTKQMTIFYLADRSSPPPAGYTKAVFHLAGQEAPCRECHQLPTADASSVDQSSCASCHARMLNEAHVHGPAGVFECLYCHDAGSAPLKYQPRAGDATVCTECHDDQLQVSETQKYLHGPLQTGMCLVCHDPHASAQPGQLVVEVSSLCLSCHAAVADSPHVTSGTSGASHVLQGPSNPMDPTKPFGCSSCHDPHGGASESYFVGGVEGRMNLCVLCHKK